MAKKSDFFMRDPFSLTTAARATANPISLSYFPYCSRAVPPFVLAATWAPPTTRESCWESTTRQGVFSVTKTRNWGFLSHAEGFFLSGGPMALSSSSSFGDITPAASGTALRHASWNRRALQGSGVLKMRQTLRVLNFVKKSAAGIQKLPVSKSRKWHSLAISSYLPRQSSLLGPHAPVKSPLPQGLRSLTSRSVHSSRNRSSPILLRSNSRSSSTVYACGDRSPILLAAPSLPPAFLPSSLCCTVSREPPCSSASISRQSTPFLIRKSTSGSENLTIWGAPPVRSWRTRGTDPCIRHS
mmetsp:Transcript_31785/g.80861  ORF Transcript_31785/g.80861 Transcript_31785/m.80861 type:complete len:299 (-) Transcript_31785:2265-3161(-)